MKTKGGKQIVKCSMTDNSETGGNCPTCMYRRVVGEFGEDYCCDPKAEPSKE